MFYRTFFCSTGPLFCSTGAGGWGWAGEGGGADDQGNRRKTTHRFVILMELREENTEACWNLDGKGFQICCYF